jgi:signal transduction histidine kinase
MSNNEALTQENLALKQSIEELNLELNRVNKLLSDSEALKSHFISNITNEIVNPFASILGLTESLKELDEADFNRSKSISARIHKEALDLNYQLKNVFAAAKLEAGLYMVEPSSCNIKELLSEVLYSYEDAIRNKNIKLLSEVNLDNEIIISDSDKLKLILSNLISNAIKYTPDKGVVKILIDLRDSFIVRISDSGIGFEEDQLQALFERFRQLDEEINTINKGYGLGLSVVKACIDLMGGQLIINSKPKEGSEFTIQLPIIDQTEFDDDILFDEDGIF